MDDDGADDTTRLIDLLVVGEVNPDVIVSDADPRPVFGQAERLVREIRLTIGSSSAITACAAARLGLRVAMVGVVGDDVFGRFMTASLRERGVDVSAIRVAEDLPTGASVVLSDGRDRAILTARGTISSVSALDIPPRLLERARHLHIGSWFLQDGLRPDAAGLLARASEAGVTTSVDPNWDPAGAWDGGLRALLTALDVLFLNEEELRRIVGVMDVDEAAVMLARLGRRGREGAGDLPRPLVAVKCGAAGALVASADGVLARVGAYPVEAIDTTGAGDTFDAAFLAARLDGAGPADALRAGAVAGALATTTLGGTEGQPTSSDLEDALRSWPA
jgi:sugar/nucleoside kinase (ribokinase family)